MCSHDPSTYTHSRISNALLRECLAEFLGTMVLIMFGDGVVAQTVLSAGGAGSALSIHICWGLAVLFGILVSAGVSGAHLNPAVSIALAAFGKFDWRKLGPYIASQMLGAFTGAALVYSVYIDSLNAYDGGVRTVTGPTATAGIFSTYPQPYMTHLCSFWTEMVGSALLMGGIFAIGDSKNANLPGAAGPFTVAALVASIGMAFGYPTVCASHDGFLLVGVHATVGAIVLLYKEKGDVCICTTASAELQLSTCDHVCKSTLLYHCPYGCKPIIGMWRFRVR